MTSLMDSADLLGELVYLLFTMVSYNGYLLQCRASCANCGKNERFHQPLGVIEARKLGWVVGLNRAQIPIP